MDCFAALTNQSQSGCCRSGWIASSLRRKSLGILSAVALTVAVTAIARHTKNIIVLVLVRAIVAVRVTAASHVQLVLTSVWVVAAVLTLAPVLITTELALAAKCVI